MKVILRKGGVIKQVASLFYKRCKQKPRLFQAGVLKNNFNKFSSR